MEQIDIKDIDQVEVLMLQLIQINKDNNETLKSTYDENSSI